MSIWKGLALLLMLTGVTETLWAQQIYQWTDAQGNKHFSDSVPPSGEPSTVIPLAPLPKTGAQFANPGALKSESTPSVKSSRTATLPSVPYRPDNICRRQPEQCFTKEDQKICLLRYGIACVDLFFWKTKVREACEKAGNEHCDDPVRYINRRPAALQARDLKTALPHTSQLDKHDQDCLLTHGFYCAEIRNEDICRKYDMPCGKLQTWVERSKIKCREKFLKVECEDSEYLHLDRPRSIAEIKFVGVAGGGPGNTQRRIIQDYLIIDSGVNRDDPNYKEVMQGLLDDLPGF